jgi:hypothetical protein
MTSHNRENDINLLKSKASLFDHCCITVSSLLDHCYFQMVLFHQQIFNHTSNALLKDKLWSITSQKLENDIKELKSKESPFDHCCITVLSLLDHFLITVFSNGLLLQKDITWSMTSQKLENKRIKHDQWHIKNNSKKLKSKASLFNHCCITVSSLSHHCLITGFVKR